MVSLKADGCSRVRSFQDSSHSLVTYVLLLSSVCYVEVCEDLNMNDLYPLGPNLRFVTLKALFSGSNIPRLTNLQNGHCY